MIYDEPGEIVRRYGKTGWKVIARKNDGSPHELLITFFDSQYGYWPVYDRKKHIYGMNEIDWETKGEIVYFENQFTDCKAKIMQSTLLEVISNLHAWKNANQPQENEETYPPPEMDTDTNEGEEYVDPTACEGCGYLKSCVEPVETDYGLSRLCAECKREEAPGVVFVAKGFGF